MLLEEDDGEEEEEEGGGGGGGGVSGWVGGWPFAPRQEEPLRVPLKESKRQLLTSYDLSTSAGLFRGHHLPAEPHPGSNPDKYPQIIHS